MRITTYICALLFVTSCSPYPKGLHDDCRTYLKDFRAQWKRLPNGFYVCEALNAERKHRFFTNAYLFDQEWQKHQDCVFQLSPKAVKRIFGKPSRIVKGKNEVHNFKSIAYYYYIKDSTCNPKMGYPYTPGTYDYNWLGFAFYNGKQSRLRPRLELSCEQW
ncbi:MAG: hypothetical protein J0L99_12025 [Chitinophagales bacterium]|nr:hypothetical protein [Chitinophagales bacterium]